VVVAGRIRDIGKNLLQSSFLTGCSSSPIYIQIFFLIAVFEEALLRNIITLRIHYTIIITSIINNNSVIINNYRKFEDFISLFKIPMGARKNSFHIYSPMEQGPQKGSPGLAYSNPRQARFPFVSSFFKFHTTLCFRSSRPTSAGGEKGGGWRPHQECHSTSIQLANYHYDLSLWDTFIWTYRWG